MSGASWLGPDAPERLVGALASEGYRVVGPRVEDGTLVLGELASDSPLPSGWTDDAAPGRYRLVDAEAGPESARRFGFRVGAHSFKRFLHPPEARLFTARQDRGALEVEPEPPPDHPLALLGARPCDVAAIRVQDRVLLEGPHTDGLYAERRRGAFLVAVECVSSNATCFCASMGTGPALRDGADIVLTEVLDASRHGFVARAGTPRGAAVLRALNARDASDEEQRDARRAVEGAAKEQRRGLDLDAVRSALAGGEALPMWDEVAERCLACANCTLVCPTCFCTTVVDGADLSGRVAERRRHWDSCFGLEFSYLHGGSVRQSTAARYRHWMIHKLSSWFEQFGEAGCVGCGRCIAWCPVGIDITEQAATAIEQRAEAREAGEGRPHRGPARRGASG